MAGGEEYVARQIGPPLPSAMSYYMHLVTSHEDDSLSFFPRSLNTICPALTWSGEYIPNAVSLSPKTLTWASKMKLRGKVRQDIGHAEAKPPDRTIDRTQQL